MSVLVQRRHVVSVLAVAIGLALVFALSRASMAAPSTPDEPNPNAPMPLEFDRVEEDACPDFAVRFEGTGMLKEIEKPDGTFIFLAPGFRITLTNVEEPENQITVHNTAAFHDTFLPNGDILSVDTGQFLVWPPLQLFVGRHTLLIDGETFEIIEFVSSQGKTVDLCAQLA
jgi:hypothetical protein